MSEVLIEARRKKRLTQSELASLTGINQAAYSNIENGKRVPSVKLAKRIATILEIDWTLLFKD